MLTSKNWRETADFGYDCPSHADCPEPRAAELAPPLPRLDAQHCNSPDCAGLGGAVVQSQGREQRRVWTRRFPDAALHTGLDR